MKKLLTILGVIGLTTTASASVVACGNTNTQNNNNGENPDNPEETNWSISFNDVVKKIKIIDDSRQSSNLAYFKNEIVPGISGGLLTDVEGNEYTNSQVFEHLAAFLNYAPEINNYNDLKTEQYFIFALARLGGWFNLWDSPLKDLMKSVTYNSDEIDDLFTFFYNYFSLAKFELFNEKEKIETNDGTLTLDIEGNEISEFDGYYDLEFTEEGMKSFFKMNFREIYKYFKPDGNWTAEEVNDLTENFSINGTFRVYFVFDRTPLDK